MLSWLILYLAACLSVCLAIIVRLDRSIHASIYLVSSQAPLDTLCSHSNLSAKEKREWKKWSYPPYIAKTADRIGIQENRTGSYSDPDQDLTLKTESHPSIYLPYNSDYRLRRHTCPAETQSQLIKHDNSSPSTCSWCFTGRVHQQTLKRAIREERQREREIFRTHTYMCANSWPI